MALIYIRQFIVSDGIGNADTYICRYYPETGEKEVVVQGPGPEAQFVTEVQLGVADTTIVWQQCVGRDQHTVFATTLSPFIYAHVAKNSSACGFIPPTPVCDLAITSVVIEEESGINAFDGSLTINATSTASGIVVRQYSLDGIRWQLSNQFTGLNAGAYCVFVKETGGCRASKSVVLTRLVEAPQSTSVNFPWQERLCYFFRLIRDGVAETIAEPIKWDAIGITGERDKDYHGWNSQYSDGEAQLEFDCPAGKEILEAAYTEAGSDAETGLIYGYAHENTDYILFEGKLNYNTYKWHPSHIAISVERKDITDKLRSRIDTKVSMSADKDLDGQPINPAKPLYITLHAKSLLREHRLTNDEKVEHFPF